jgi:hypothetical protein
MSTLTDNQVIQIFLPLIQQGLIADNFLNVLVKQSNQPTQQGVPKTPVVYFFKVANKRFGFTGRYDKYSMTTLDHHEVQYIESTFRVSALVLQFPITPNQYTASDLVNDVASIMMSSNTIDVLNSHGIGILRTIDIINPYFVDDRDQFEASPSFDFTLVYKSDRISSVPVITNYDYNLLPI